MMTDSEFLGFIGTGLVVVASFWWLLKGQWK